MALRFFPTALACAAACCLCACHSMGDPAKPAASEGTADMQIGGRREKGAAELWAESCSHCHILRDAPSYGHAQWDAVMLHMRVRANLTAAEHEKILKFLKSSN